MGTRGLITGRRAGRHVVSLVVFALLLALGAAPAALAQDATPGASPEAEAVDLGVTPFTTPEGFDAYGAQFAGSPAPSLPATVTDLNGDEIVVEDLSRIVSLSGSVTEIIFALGLGENVVGVDVSALYPPEATGPLPKVGYVRELSAEGILGLEPTLIIGNSEAGPPEIVEQIQGAGVPVVIIDAPEIPIEAPAAKIRAVAAALGVPDRGETLAGQVEARIARVQDAVASAETRPTVMFLYVRTGTQLIAGANTTADTMITAAGGVNAGAEIGLEGYVPLTAESLVEAAPDVLLLMEGGLEAAGGVDGLLEIPGIAETPAGENRAIVAFDDLYLLGQGPRTGLALLDLAGAIHPGLEIAATPVATPAA